MRGEMLWFNDVKDLGFILTEEGERLSVLGPASGMKPVSKRQQTMAKRNREHAVQEKRTLKREKRRRRPRAARAVAKAAGEIRGRSAR